MPNCLYKSFVNVHYHFDFTTHSLLRTLQTGDFNGDGHMDLAIGAPLYSVPSNLEQGRVYVVYGKLILTNTPGQIAIIERNTISWGFFLAD